MKNEKKRWLFRTLLLLMLTLMAVPSGASAAVSMNKKTFTLTVGKSAKLKLKGLTGTETSIEWKVRRENVADVAPTGTATAKVTAKEEGVTYIYAVVDGVKYRCKLTVKSQIPAIRLNKTKKSIRKGKTYQLKASLDPENSGAVKIKWKSSNKKVAKVNSKGKVTAVGKGKATITAYEENGNAVKATCKITVKLASMQLNTSQLNLVVGQKTKLSVVSGADGAALKWSSSNKAIANVNKSGKVKGKKEGTAVITAKRVDNGCSVSCTVTVTATAVPTTEPQTVTTTPQASAYAQQLLTLMQKYSDQVKADKAAGIKWTYSNNAKNNWADAYSASRKNKVGYMNCALGCRWALREMGLLDSSNFWGEAGGNFTFHGTSKEQLLQHCVIIPVKKTPNELLAEGNLLPGDICSYVSQQHTNVYAGNGLWYECGRCGLNGGYVNGTYVFDSFGPVASVSMSGTKIGTIIRFVK